MVRVTLECHGLKEGAELNHESEVDYVVEKLRKFFRGFDHFTVAVQDGEIDHGPSDNQFLQLRQLVEDQMDIEVFKARPFFHQREIDEYYEDLIRMFERWQTKNQRDKQP